MNELAPRQGSLRRRHCRSGPWDTAPWHKFCGPDQGHPLWPMRLAPATMEVSRGEVSDLVAKDFSKNALRCRRQVSREANDPTAHMNSAKGSTKATTPLDTDAPLQASQ